MYFVALSDLFVCACYYFYLEFQISSTPLLLSCVLFLLFLFFYLDDDPLQPVTSDETVSVGGTVTLTCRVTENDNSSLQWSNTAQQTLYFGGKRGERQRYGKQGRENLVSNDISYKIHSNMTNFAKCGLGYT